MKTKSFIIIFAVLFAALLCAALVIKHADSGTVANIYRDGRLVESVDLSAVTEAYSFTLDDGNGHVNVIEVEPGRIRVAEANCPDGICVATGWLSHGSRPIVCMPAKLVIKLERAQDDGFDSVAGMVFLGGGHEG